MTTKIDIISGFLGAGKTTMINKLLTGGVLGENIAIIENEYGDINIDSGRIDETGIEIKSITSGCICCSLQGEFDIAMKELIATYKPSRIIIEPTGVGKLSDIITTINRLKQEEDVDLNIVMTIIDALEFEDYIHIFGTFFKDQIEYAETIFLSKAQFAEEADLDDVIKSVRAMNMEASLVNKDWDDLSPQEVLDIAESKEAEGLDLPHHHHHHDEKDFDRWSMETSKIYEEEEVENILDQLKNDKYGQVYRGKGFVAGKEGYLSFDYLPSYRDIETSKDQAIGQIVVIGYDLNKEELEQLWK